MSNPDINAAPTVILVHGAWADGSSWSKVIRRLQADGLSVRAAQLPLTALEDDVAALRRVLADTSGPIVLVGHSWGGSVITEAGNDAKVRALVYVAAFSNDAGETGADLLEPYPRAGVMDAIRPDGQGFLLVTEAGMADVIAADLPKEETQLLVAVQRPLSAATFGDKVTAAAWRTLPAWYIVSGDDRAISPQMQRDLAARMKAKTIELPASHMSVLSHPDEVAAVVKEAVAAVAADTSQGVGK